jgi:hypothetical protein
LSPKNALTAKSWRRAARTTLPGRTCHGRNRPGADSFYQNFVFDGDSGLLVHAGTEDDYFAPPFMLARVNMRGEL